ncbi:MAG: alpha/beta hydrolase fold domain-containing protein [Duncaniella sp.]|nr:alpha/beta hydrolase fold domain-containing protein [Duncaniella sp.]
MRLISVMLCVMLFYISGKAQTDENEFKGKTLCVLGDSYVRNHKRPFSESWHAKMAQKLGMNYVNFGRNGSSIAYDRTSDGFGPAMTQRYLEMPDSADYILVIAGHNDADYVAKHGHWAKFEAGLDSLCAGLREKYNSKPIGFVTPWGVDRPYFKAVINEIKRTCAKYGIPVLDVSDNKIIEVNNPEFRAKYFQGPNDTAHLNNAGHDLMIETGERFFRKVAQSEYSRSCCAVKNPEPGIHRDTSFTAYSTNKKVLKHHPEAVLLPCELPDGVKAYSNVVYATYKDTPYGNRDMHVDIFRPDNEEIYPALIMIHGGGWNSGDKSLQVPMAQRIASNGYVTIPVEYRMTPEAKYPAALHDIKTAVRWVRANASKYGVDPDRIAVSGCSAGAQLATLVGVTNGSKRHEYIGELAGVSSDVQAIINMDGIATFVSESNIEDAIQRLATKGSVPVNALWLGGMYDDAKDNWEEASAVLWITKKSAPICFISSGLPRYSDGRDSLVGIYDSLGIYSERHQIPVDVHPFWFFTPWVEPTIEYAVNFLDKILKRED